MKCPRCQSSITATPDAEGFLICPGCGARLRSRSAPATVGALTAARAGRRASPLAEGERFPDATNPNATLPPGTPLPRIPRPGSPEARAIVDDPPPLRARDEAPRVMRASGPRDVPREAAAEDTARIAAVPATLEGVMAEVRALRRLQEETLALLRAGRAPSAEPGSLDVAGELGLPIPTAVRAHHRKTVLLVDDDPLTRASAKAALEGAEIPVRTVSDGRAALAAMAEESPDVIVLELEMAGAVAGKDVVNMIKATMEWVAIPIVLYTRAPIAGQKEARSSHGADELVAKVNGPEALLARVVTLFRRG